MKIPHLPLLTALLMSALPALPAWAQASAPAARASAPPAPAPKGPRLLSPAEKRANANAATSPDQRPERPVVPQIKIPFGKAPPPAPAPAPPPLRKAPPNGVGDTAARCDALTTEEERAACRKPRISAPN